MRLFKAQRLSAAMACIALFFYALSPVFHGLIHGDHEIEAVLQASSADGAHHHAPAHTPQKDDCALYHLYAGHGAGALGAPGLSVLPALLPVAHAPLPRISPLPAGAPRGFALGRGPPLDA